MEEENSWQIPAKGCIVQPIAAEVGLKDNLKKFQIWVNSNHFTAKTKRLSACLDYEIAGIMIELFKSLKKFRDAKSKKIIYFAWIH